MAEPLTPEPYEIDDLAWLVWYARKKRGKAEDVARAAWDENPYIRRSSASQADSLDVERLARAIERSGFDFDNPDAAHAIAREYAAIAGEPTDDAPV